MTDIRNDSPSAWRRLMAVISLVSTALLVVLVVLLLISDLLALLVGLVGLVLVVAGGWWIVTEHMPRRLVGIIVAVGGLIILILGAFWASDGIGPFLKRAGAFLLLAGISAVCARLALVREMHEVDLSGLDIVRPKKPVLIGNEKSGGGKVVKFGLLDIAARLGVETVLLTPGDDLAQLARDAIARGADCIGMAGGDGSQALVASVAAEHEIPFVCIPAGTRNHFALDLGLDREDPRKAMAAFREGALRRIDYGTVGDRLFVNNVSLGVYATIVQQDDYRDAKLATSRELLPDLVGRTADGFDLQFTTPDGEEVDDVFIVLVSNNPYVIGPSLSSSERPSLTTGRLGVVAVRAKTGGDAVAVLAEALLRLHGGGLIEFTAEDFEVRSHGGQAYAGIDGEALQLPTPLEFRIHPGGLTLLVPVECAHGPHPSGGRAVDVRTLLNVAAGRGR